MKTRKWPAIVGAVVGILLVAFAAGAASAYQSESGDGWPLAVVTTVGIAMAPVIIGPLILRKLLPRRVTVTARPGVTHFTIAPLEPFTTSIAAARWQLGDGTALPKFGSFARPLVAADAAGVTIWRAAGDELPLVTVPAASVRSITSEERTIQVSRTGVTNRVFCIVLELMIGRTGVTLILPACTPVNDTNRATRQVVDAWAAQLRGTLEPEANQQQLRG